MKKQYKVLDLSGYMFSGKHALNLLIKELDGYAVPEFDLEFNLLRVQDGIMDLEKALVDDWSLIRSNSAIKRYKKLIKKFDGTYSKFPYFLFNFHTDYYQTMFKNKFSELSNQYVKNLTTASWQSDWPYPLYDMNNFESFSRKIKKRFGDKEKAYQNEYNLVDGENFYKYTKEYLHELLSNFDEVNNKTKTIVTNNAFEPFNPSRCLNYFADAKCIVVKRDPRDMYATGIDYAKMSHGDRIENFIDRFLVQQRNTNKNINKNILYLQYEDLILDYENTILKVFNFLEIDKSKHILKGKYLKPEESKRFIGIYKKIKNQDDIKLIEKKLKDYCLNI